MKVVDTNVLVHAVNRSSPQHDPSRTWLTGALRSKESIAMPWLVLVGFVRVTTQTKALPTRLTIDAAFGVVERWLAQPRVICPEAGQRHAETMRTLLAASGVGGNLTNDAHLAAIALEHRATVVSYDTDFGKLPGLTWRTPDQLLQEGK